MGLGLAACRSEKTENAKENSPPPPPAPLAELRLPVPTDDPKDPLWEWRLELTRRRLSSIPNLAWQCVPGPEGAILVTPPEPCESFLAAQDSALFPALECHKGSLRIPRRTCSSGATTYPSVFDQLRLSDGSSLYRSAPSRTLTPIATDLPTIRFVEAGEATSLAVPSARQWLKQGGTTGSFAVVLTIEGNDPESWGLLGRLLESSAEAVDLPLFLDRSRAPLLGRGGSENARAATLPFLQIQSSETGLYAEACRYVGQWLHARQLVRGQSPRGPRTRTANCRLVWAPHTLNRRDGDELVLSRLPLPFFVPSTGAFPIRSLEEGLSPAQIRSLAK